MFSFFICVLGIVLISNIAHDNSDKNEYHKCSKSRKLDIERIERCTEHID